MADDEHVFRPESGEDDEGYHCWRWVCDCGSYGRWNYQSRNVAVYAWARHAGVDPTTIDQP